MTIEYRVGNLFESGLPAIGHGCNCAGAMGRGIAVEFRRRWPAMYSEYRRRCADGSFGLGDLFVWEASERFVLNLGTQRTWRSGADPAAIASSVRAAVDWAAAVGVDSIGLPRLGAGLGGLDWSAVESAIEPIAAPSAVQVVVFDLAPGR